MIRIFLVLMLFSMITTNCTQNEKVSPNQGPMDSLAVLENEVRQHFLDKDIDFRLKYGLPILRLPDISYEHALEEKEFTESVLSRLNRIGDEGLTEVERLSQMALRWQLEMAIEGFQYFWFKFPCIPYSNPSLGTVERVFTQHPFKEAQDLETYRSLLEQYALLIQAVHSHYQEQADRGILMPQAQLDLVIPMFQAFNKPLAMSPLVVLDDRLTELEPKAVAQFQTTVAMIINKEIQASFDKFIAYLSGPYREKAPETVGLSQYPNGKACYKYWVRYYTTLELSPEEIHARGIEAVGLLNEKIDGIQAQMKFNGSRTLFRDWLKTDPRFFATSPEEIGEKLMNYITRLEPQVDRFFSMQPTAPYGVERLPAALEGSMTFGYYQWPTVANPKGHYLYNGSNLKDRSLLTAASLIYHELVPGHHFQIATQYEIEGISDFRRDSFHTAYTEGWAEYASGLAWEMDGYDTLEDQLGRYFSEMFFAVRLVVDTGMNALGWSREKAMAFMAENLLESDLQIQTESLRYSVPIPGQALAYRIGAEKIRELRARAQSTLGDRFDIRKFHRAVLENGSLPLSVLEQRIDWFIETERAMR